MSEQSDKEDIIYGKLQTMLVHGSLRCKCQSTQPLSQMYRCFHCGLWLCEACSKEHFGEKIRKWLSEGEEKS